MRHEDLLAESVIHGAVHLVKALVQHGDGTEVPLPGAADGPWGADPHAPAREMSRSIS
eukprot:gene54385-2119_t